jgi:hypothetical protein
MASLTRSYREAHERLTKPLRDQIAVLDARLKKLGGISSDIADVENIDYEFRAMCEKQIKDVQQKKEKLLQDIALVADTIDCNRRNAVEYLVKQTTEVESLVH